MKKQVSDFVKSLGGQTSYSGNTKTMWIDHAFIQNHDIEDMVIKKFGYGLHFRLASQ